MLLIRLVAGAIFVHEALYLCRDGRGYLTRSFLPILGLRLPGRAQASLHLALMGVCLGLVAAPWVTILLPLGLLVLTLVIASYPLRLSNHLIVAWFMLAFLTLAVVRDPRGQESWAFAWVGIQGVVVLVYFFSFFHKLNRDFLSAHRSCAAQLSDFFCWDRGIRSPALAGALRHFAIYGTLLVEGALGILLLVPATRHLGLLIALGFHFALALQGIVNFSAVMYAGLVAFLPIDAPGPAGELVFSLHGNLFALTLLLTLALVWSVTPRRASRHCPYVQRKPAWVIQFLFGALTAWLLLLFHVYGARPRAAVGPGWRDLDSPDLAIVAVLLGLFFLNGAGPYLGYKTEFSMAMFSNLRHEPWTHLLFPSSWRLFHPRYWSVQEVRGLPDPADLDGDGDALLAHQLLLKPRRLRFRAYFLDEALRRFRELTGRTPLLRLRDPEGSPGLFPIGGDEGGAPPPRLDFLPLVLFPFVLPEDPDAPHSEQGSVVGENRERQYF